MKISKGLAFLFSLAALIVPAFAAAQTIESLEWVGGADGSVARIVFNGNVRFLRQVPTQEEAADQLQLSFQIITADENVLKQVIEEGKRLPGAEGKPRIDLTYVPLASVATKLLTLRFSAPLQVQVKPGPNSRSIDLVLVQRDEPPMPPMAELSQDRHFAVLLKQQDSQQALPRLPSQLQAYALFNRRTEKGDTGPSELLLGYFFTETDAHRVLERVLPQYPEARVIPWNVVDTASAPAPAQEAAAPLATASEVEAKGRDSLIKGKQAIAEKRYQDAVDIFNQALMLPPNPSAQESQDLIGQAWEALNKPDKARLEYQLYLKLYPDSPESARITRRIESIDAMARGDQAVATGPKPATAEKKHYSATGSISQFYYGGNTQSQTLVNIASGIDQVTLNQTNQSVLVTSWDAAGRYDSENGGTNVVFRGSNAYNLSSNSATSAGTQGLIGSAYLDFHGTDSRTALRVGRQQAIGAAMFGLFDGVSVTTPVATDYKASAMLGVPANALVNAPSQVLTGVMLEANNLAPHWGGSVSLVDQTTEHISDRRAVGLDVRYFGETASMFTQLDYDTNFNVLNAVTVQGSMPGPWDTTWSMMLDDRKAPSLQLSDALIVNTGFTSLSQLLASGKTISQLQADALGIAAEAKQAMVGVSRAMSPKWQAGIDWEYSDISALPQIGNFQAMPATGAQYTVTLQLTGTNLYSNRDINGFNLSYLTSSALVGTQLGYNNSTGIWGGKASIEPSIHYYTQQDSASTTVTRITPGLRLSYKLSDRASLMGETIYESSQTDGPQTHETSTAIYFYVGYRYDFQ